MSPFSPFLNEFALPVLRRRTRISQLGTWKLFSVAEATLLNFARVTFRADVEFRWPAWRRTVPRSRKIKTGDFLLFGREGQRSVQIYPASTSATRSAYEPLAKKYESVVRVT